MVYSAEHAELELRLVLSVKPESNCLLCVLTGSAFYLSLSLSLCLSVCLSLSLCLSVSVSLSVSLSLCLSVSVCLSVSLSLSLSLSLKRYIKVHRSRFKLYNVDELKCPLCLSAVDNEVHFVLRCPAFYDLRYDFTESKYFNNPCEFRFALLLATHNESALKNLAVFLYIAFSRRKTLLS